eukprot:20699_1
MPSFSNGNGNYHYFLNLPKHAQTDLNSTQTLCIFFKYMTCSILCGLLMHSWHFIWDYFDANDYGIFMKHKWYFEFDMLLVTWQCILIITLSLLLTSTLYPHDTFYRMAMLQHKRDFIQYLLLIVLLTVACLVPIAYLTFVEEEKGIQPVFPSSSPICDWLLCKFIYIRFMLIYCLYPGALPLILWCCWYIYYLCYLQSKAATYQTMMDHQQCTKTTALLNAAHPNINSIDTKRSSQWSFRKHLFQNDPVIEFDVRYPLSLLVLWCVSFMLSFLFGYIHGRPIEQYFETIYFTFSAYTVCFKFVMKKLARRCDFYRSMVSDNNYIFSMEYFMEFYWSLTYWMIYRFYTVFHAPTISEFVITLTAHLGWEFCAVIVRYHHKYYSNSNVFIERYYYYLYFLHDGRDCTLGIWRDRLSMDLVVKLWCAVFSGLFFALDYKVCFDMYANQLGDKASSELVVSYLVIATMVEFLFYVATIQFGRFVLDYNIMFPFVYYCKRLTKTHMMLIVFMYGCVVIPVY